MEQFLAALTIIVVLVILVVRYVNKKSARANEHYAILHEGGVEPDYVFVGKASISLSAMARGSEFGITLAIYRKERFIRVILYGGGIPVENAAYQIDFTEIIDVEKQTHASGVYGQYTISPTIITLDSESYPFPKIYIATITYEVYDKLREALGIA